MKYPSILSIVAILGGLAIVLVVVLWNVGAIYASAEYNFRWSTYAFGSGGALAALIGSLTAAGAFLTVWLLIVRADHDRETRQQSYRVEVADRFKTAGEMLASESWSQARAGMSLLVEVVRLPGAESYAPTAAQMLLPMRESVTGPSRTDCSCSTRLSTTRLVSFGHNPAQ